MKLGTPVGYSHKADLNVASGYGTYMLYLASHKEAFVDEQGSYLSQYAGLTMCPGASPECFGHCLTHSGQMIMPHAKQARIRKTRLLLDNPSEFGRLLHWDVDAHLRWCQRNGMLPSFRFNGTSDYHFEDWVVPHLGINIHQYILDVSPGSMINEYTKRFGVMKRWLSGAYLKNLYMTFSLHEKNELQAREILRFGGNVAVVFRTKKHHPLPSSWWGHPVFDGDTDDLRWMDAARARRAGLDPSRGLVVGLRAKGQLARRESPFAIDPIVTRIALPLAA